MSLGCKNDKINSERHIDDSLELYTLDEGSELLHNRLLRSRHSYCGLDLSIWSRIRVGLTHTRTDAHIKPLSTKNPVAKRIIYQAARPVANAFHIVTNFDPASTTAPVVETKEGPCSD